MSEEFKDYGVTEYIPENDRHYGFVDMAATWVGANANASSWYIGGVVAAATFGGAIGITFIANPMCYLFLALIGYMGFKVRTTSMGLVRVPFGIKGSILPSICNLVQFLGWGAVNSFIGAITISYLCAELFGTPAYGEPGAWWILALGALLNNFLSYMGVIIAGSRSIKVFERVAVVGMVGLSIWITVVVLQTMSFSEIWAWRPDESVRLPFGMGVDAMVAFSLSWFMAVAEFTRYCKTKASATIAPMIGANIAIFWFALVGTMGVIAVAVQTGVFNPDYSDPSSVAASLGLGWAAFIVIITATVTTNMIGLYAGGLSFQNIAPKVKIKNVWTGMFLITNIISWIPIWSGSFLYSFYGFLEVLGALFGPLLGIMIVDFYILRKGDYQQSQLDIVGGPYWYKNGFNWYGLVAWGLGVAGYFVLSSLNFGINSVGAIFPGVFVASLIYYISAQIGIKNNAYVDLIKKEA